MAFYIIGDQDTVLGYRFAGVTGVAVETVAEARQAFATAVQAHEHHVLLLTEQVEAMLAEETTGHRLAARPPYLVVVGDIAGTRVQRKSLEDLIHEAVGIKILPEHD